MATIILTGTYADGTGTATDYADGHKVVDVAEEAAGIAVRMIRDGLESDEFSYVTVEFYAEDNSSPVFTVEVNGTQVPTSEYVYNEIMERVMTKVLVSA